MAVLTLDRTKLRANFEFLQTLFGGSEADWGVVTKLLCGHAGFIREVLALGVKEVHDSRVSNLKMIKKLAPDVQTVYIKPAPKRSIPAIVQYADVSLQTDLETMRMLSLEAARQNKTHKVIIMVEMGDLREGVMGEHLVDFYEQVFELSHIEIIGLGTNLNCLHGVMPSQDKLIQLSLYRQIIELKFKRKIPWISGGTSVSVPLLLQHRIPPGVNHFRIGETLFFGADLFTETTIAGMQDDVFELKAEIIELYDKPVLPTGEMGANPQGELLEIDESLYGLTSFRAIIDIGVLDIDPKYLIMPHQTVKVIGSSSDMIVLDLGNNPEQLKVGDQVAFQLKYMGALSLMNSYYVEKRVIES
ncbi:MAG: alanine racemase [Bacteroidia bacterium]